jgi:hypothetical protein
MNSTRAYARARVTALCCSRRTSRLFVLSVGLKGALQGEFNPSAHGAIIPRRSRFNGFPQVFVDPHLDGLGLNR